MHVLEYIIMAEKEAQKQTSDSKRLQALEAKAVAEATATADAAFIPSPSLLNATTPGPLLKQVDGPSLQSYEGKESVYVGRSVPVSAGGILKVPIQVTTPGSVVEYAVENKSHDFAFGITAEREEGITVVKVRLFQFIPDAIPIRVQVPGIYISTTRYLPNYCNSIHNDPIPSHLLFSCLVIVLSFLLHSICHVGNNKKTLDFYLYVYICIFVLKRK